ncbi:hypothetical protein C1H46_039617 [Malus baccata]|uniref:Uncharacterized protein n=1 Tax=Malus baccata TaxID=106549 RepID=A0A540KL14_MALBA|nr:hypothetical protein C1H46_039617 [Malus baccata]
MGWGESAMEIREKANRQWIVAMESRRALAERKRMRHRLLAQCNKRRPPPLQGHGCRRSKAAACTSYQRSVAGDPCHNAKTEPSHAAPATFVFSWRWRVRWSKVWSKNSNWIGNWCLGPIWR